MAFSISKFSDDGLILLSQIASSQSALKIKQIFASEEAFSVEDVNESVGWWEAQTEETMDKVDATVTGAGIYDEEARVLVGLSLKPTQTETVAIKSIIMTACAVEPGTPDDEGPEVVLLMVVNDSEVGLEIIAGEGTHESVAIYFKFENASTIYLQDGTTADYVTHTEANRYVTCHAIGDATSGDAQTILGNKTFEDTIYVSTMQAISATDRIMIANRGTTNPCAVSIGWHSSISRNAVMIGGLNYGWVFDNQYLKPLVASTSQIGTPTESVNTIYAGALGDSSNRTDTVYATVADATVLRTNAITSASDTIALEKTILPSTTETYNLGQPQHKFNEIHANNFYGNLVGGSAGGVFTNMTASGTFNGAFNGDLNGLIPQPTEAESEATYQPAPIGSIILALIDGWGWSDNTYAKCGKLLSQGVTCTLYPARYDAQSGFIVNTSVLLPLEQGLYRMLSDVNTHLGSNERRMIALMMRVS